MLTVGCLGGRGSEVFFKKLRNIDLADIVQIYRERFFAANTVSEWQVQAMGGNIHGYDMFVKVDRTNAVAPKLWSIMHKHLSNMEIAYPTLEY